MNWREEEQEHRNKLKQTFPISANKPRVKGYEKSPHRSRMTSHLMSTSFRYKNTTIATLLKAMLERGQAPRAISEILRFGIEVVENYLVNSEESYRFNTESEAIDFLQANGINPGQSEKNAKRIINSIITENTLFERSFQRVNVPMVQSSNINNYVSQEDVNKAMSILNEKLQESPHFDRSIVSQDNKVEAPPTQRTTVDMSHLVLKADGSTFKVKQDRSKTGRRSVCIICSKCKRNPSYVLLDFEPNEGQPILADCCKNCEGITPHFIVSSANAKNGFVPSVTPTTVPVDEMKRILQAPPESTE